MACQRSMTQKKEREREKRWHTKEAWPSKQSQTWKGACIYLCTNLISHKYEYKPVDPIFDLAIDLSQADDILPHPSKLHIYHQSRWGKIRINAGKKLWATLRDPWKRVRPWTIFQEKFFQKSPSLATWQDDTWSQDHSVLQQLKISWYTHSSSIERARYGINLCRIFYQEASALPQSWPLLGMSKGPSVGGLVDGH